MLLKERNNIIAWLDKYGVEDYTLVPDETYGFVVDVVGNVFLTHRSLIEIPVKFGIVNGGFYCSGNDLTSLEGCPVHVERDFSCADNQLISLEGIPESIGGSFYFSGNRELGELQNITDLKAIKSYLLAKQLDNELNMKDNKRKIKL